MAISETGAYQEEIGGASRRLILRNGEIERFEIQYAPFGIFELWDQLFGRGGTPQVRHVRDIVALGLVGGGMSDRAADDLVASLPPSENMRLRAVAQRLLGVTFIPDVLSVEHKKKEHGSRKPRVTRPDDMTPPTASEQSVA